MESLLSEDRAEVDLAIALELAERINQSKEELIFFLFLKTEKRLVFFFDRRKIAVECLRQGLLKSNSQIVLNSVLVKLRLCLFFKFLYIFGVIRDISEKLQ
jgi:hypothetical protein